MRFWRSASRFAASYKMAENRLEQNPCSWKFSLTRSCIRVCIDLGFSLLTKEVDGSCVHSGNSVIQLF